jgi:16S rRNA pseudouridine516 synthase
MGKAKTKVESGMRLDAYLARAGLASRREARALIRRGEVCVAGEVCRDSARQVTDQEVRLGDEIVASPRIHRDYILHKPVGFACSEDDREAPLVRELLSDALRRRSLRIAGRLDRATSGLLLLTSDGDLVHCVTHPTRKLSKRYRVTYSGVLVEDAVTRCAEGFVLGKDDRPTRPAELSVGDPGQAILTLREGRTHQVRRMIRALGGEVVSLHRDRIGGLELPVDLEEGDLRPLDPEERALLLSDSSL